MNPTRHDPFVRPPALRPGARIALVSPAGPSARERVDAARARCTSLGFEPVAGRHARDRHGYLAGTDADRLTDLDHALRDPTVAAVWAVRGGYGTLRLVDRLDIGHLRATPRAFIGFSDNTAIHLLFAKTGLVSFHGPHAGGPFPDFTAATFQRTLCRAEPAGLLPADDAGGAPVTLRGGVAEGRLTGGNLALLAATCGTPFQMDARGAIVVIEDVNEPAYRVDRALTQLRLAGCLTGAAAVAFGRFAWTDPVPISDAAGPGTALQAGDVPLEDVLADRVCPLGVPVVAGLPFGHVDGQWTLPFGVRARLDADRGTLEILEPAVA